MGFSGGASLILCFKMKKFTAGNDWNISFTIPVMITAAEKINVALLPVDWLLDSW